MCLDNSLIGHMETLITIEFTNGRIETSWIDELVCFEALYQMELGKIENVVEMNCSLPPIEMEHQQ